MGALRPCVLFLCVLLASVSAVNRLNNIDDLRNVDYGRPAPRHGFQLLFWFSQQVRNIDQNGILTLDSNFNPERGDFGFHHFKNIERILPTLKQGRKYYSVGNLYSPGANALPDYVKAKRDKSVLESNMDRLMVSLHPNSPNRVYNVFITAHNRGSNDFNSAATYEIDSALIQEIRGHPTCTVEQNNMYVINTQEAKRCCRFLELIQYSKDNRGFDHLKTRSIKDHLFKPTFCNKPGSDDANEVIPTRIKGFTASLQLYTEDSKACARLYIKKTFSNWKDVFYYSWVGFYTGLQIANDQYSTYQYAVNFEKVEGESTEDYDIYKYQSDLVIAPEIQIRFLLDKNYDKVLSETTPWEGAEKVMISPSDCELQPGQSKDSSYWSNPQIIYRPDFDDANRVIPTEIRGYDASLQLYTKDGKACARLYIKKTFSNWKDVFSYSWVGFYTATYKDNDEYSTYQYAVHFEKVEGESTEDFYICEYQSDLAIAPGVQIRFLLDEGYNNVRARTTPWDGRYISWFIEFFRQKF